MMTTVTARRRPRFAAIAPIQNMALTPRDLVILAIAAHHHFITGPQIALRVHPMAPVCADCSGRGRVPAAVGDTSCLPCVGTGRREIKKILERIGTLYGAGLLTRPPAQLDYWRPGAGSQRLIYGLSSAGARLLMDSGTLPRSERVEHSLKAALASKRFIHHTVAITTLSCALHAARHASSNVVLAEGLDLQASLPAKTQARLFPFKLSANLALGSVPQPAAVIPDWPFTLAFTHPRSEKRIVRGYLAEIDMGTMPIKRTTAHGTSLMKKFWTYHAAAEAEQHMRDFEWSDFRVPVITTSGARIEAIRRELLASATLARSPLFYFTTFDQLRAAENAFRLDWIKANGATTTLLPRAET